MNKDKIEQILGLFKIQDKKIPERIQIDDVTVNLENAGKTQVVFYRLHPGEAAEKVFLERFRNTTGCLLIINRKLDVMRENYVVIDEKDFFELQKAFVDHLFPLPSSMPYLVGVTGTNGKTSTVGLAMQIATQWGRSAVSVGTIGVLYNSEKKSQIKIGATTPSYIEFRKILHEAGDSCDVCFFECSSHALEQNRIGNLKLDLAAWTNFTQDHLDYHKTMANYFSAKLKIVTQYLKENGQLVISNGQDKLREDVAKRFENIILPEDLGSDRLPPYFRVEFNRHNIEVAITLNLLLWKGKAIQIDFRKIQLPLGRFEIIALDNNRCAIVDYAHTPDALERLLIATRAAFEGKKIKVLFGCGGDRDRTKRPIMGQIAEKEADYICVTSDNPRSEIPMMIINEILAGMTKGADLVEENRSMALEKMLQHLKENEVLVVAGKGHEQYQEIKGIKHNYSDYEVIERFINGSCI